MQCLSRTNYITLCAISVFVVYEIFQIENVCALPSVLCFTMFPRQTCINKQTQKQVKSFVSMWRRGTSNPAVFSNVRLSQVTEQSWQTKPQSFVDANKSHHIRWLSLLCCALLRFVCSLPLVNLLRSSVSAMHKLDFLGNITWSMKDALSMSWMLDLVMVMSHLIPRCLQRYYTSVKWQVLILILELSYGNYTFGIWVNIFP